MPNPLYDVAVIGCGPTGAILAHLLARQGLTVLVLDRESGACTLPRAVHFDGEVMRALQWIGVAEKILPLTTTHPGMRFVDDTGDTLLDWPRPQDTGPQGWRASYRFHQPDLDAILRDTLGALDTVTLKTRCEAFLFEEQPDHVALRYEDMAIGRVRHAKRMSELEDEMCDFGPDGLSGGRSPDRVDALVWAITDLLIAGRGRPRVRAVGP